MDNNDLYFSTLVTKALHPIQGDDRFFEGYLTVQVKDKQGEITIVDELIKVLPIWMDRGAPISDTHSNRIIGKGISYAQTVYKDEQGVEYPAIKVTGKIHKNYELDNEIWRKIKSGEYIGMSFGGATKSNRTPKVMKDGSVAYELTNLEHYEVAVCKDPAVPLAVITDFNPIAKAMAGHTEKRDDGKMVIKCDKFGCYVKKSDEVIKSIDPDSKRCPYCDENVNKAFKDKDLEENDWDDKANTCPSCLRKYNNEGIHVQGQRGLGHDHTYNQNSGIGSGVQTTEIIDNQTTELKDKNPDKESERDSEGKQDPETDGNTHGMYNQDVDENGSSGRVGQAKKADYGTPEGNANRKRLYEQREQRLEKERQSACPTCGRSDYDRDDDDPRDDEGTDYDDDYDDDDYDDEGTDYEDPYENEEEQEDIINLPDPPKDRKGEKQSPEKYSKNIGSDEHKMKSEETKRCTYCGQDVEIDHQHKESQKSGYQTEAGNNQLGGQAKGDKEAYKDDEIYIKPKKQ